MYSSDNNNWGKIELVILVKLARYTTSRRVSINVRVPPPRHKAKLCDVFMNDVTSYYWYFTSSPEEREGLQERNYLKVKENTKSVTTCEK